jgi:hypothetical protein
MGGAGSAVHRGPSGDDETEVYDALSDELGQLTGTAAFTTAEFAVDTATIFQLRRDEHGTPMPVWWKYSYQDGSLRAEDIEEGDPWSEAMADRERFYRRVAPRLVVCTSHQLPSGLRDLLPGPPDTPVYQCRASLGELLRAAIRDSPLVMDYELAVLKRTPAGHNGAVQFGPIGQKLFSRGDTRGCQVTVQVNVEPTDGEGTVFAVVTREPRPDLPRQSQRLRPLQVQAAIVRPDRYLLTGVLTRPGHVRFQGLPVPLGRSSRSWDDLKHLVPNQLTTQAPVHLVCLIEVCGGDDRLQQRIDRLEGLIAEAQAAARLLYVSVVAYGAHGVAWKVEDRPPEIRAWAASGREAVSALRGLVGRRVDEREYQGAAQLECALKLVREHLAPADGRPVIVTAGGRAAHPPGLDTRHQLIPCPDWVDAMSEINRLLSLPEIRFGAVRDPKWRGRIWERLGQHAVATVDDAVDMESFAADLGLRVAGQTVPFPVID